MSTDAPCTDRKDEPPVTVVVVRLEPLGIDIVVRSGVSLMRAAEEQGLHWPTVCGGDAECGACFVVVDRDSAAALPPASSKEREALRLIPPRPSQTDDDVVRLACQLRPEASIVVRKRGVRRH